VIEDHREELLATFRKSATLDAYGRCRTFMDYSGRRRCRTTAYLIARRLGERRAQPREIFRSKDEEQPSSPGRNRTTI